jgi:4-aminobutyrate aminotransferase / (S)-3-amino-2-methylpropionate transaminase / 5-aminovalerate transaminase
VRRFAQVKTALPGPRSRALTERERPFLAPGIQSISQLAGIALDGGEGAIIQDADGNRFIDFVAGICVASLGHGHPALAEALDRQARRIAAGSFTTEARVELLERIAGETSRIGSGALRRTQLYSGGSEAVESALRLARAHTKKFEVISFWGGFHGKTAGVLGLMGSDFKHGLGPLPPGVHVVPYPDGYRPPFGAATASTEQVIDHLRSVIKYQTSGSIAAILVEPIQGTNGNVLPPPDFLPEVKRVARELGALLILDEMITGWARTGRMFGQMHFDVEADILTFGKGVAGGYPVTGLVSTDAIVGSADPWSRPSFSSSSYGGAPLGAAAANAVTRVIVEERLAENAARVGETMLGALKRLEKYEFVGEVRGKGLLAAVELVESRQTKQPLAKSTCEWIFKQCLERGLLTMAYAPRVRINPPLVITEEQALEGVAILDEVFAALQQKGWKN